jgi:hypothetical protein
MISYCGYFYILYEYPFLLLSKDSRLKAGSLSVRTLARNRLAKIVLKNSRAIDVCLFPVNLLIGLYIKYLTLIPAPLLVHSYRSFSKCGWLPVTFHYYQPIIKSDMLPKNLDQIENPLIGVDLHTRDQLELLSKFHYNKELSEIPKHKMQGNEPYYCNPSYGVPDAEILYSIIRHFKPKRIIEIGAGESTKFIQRAIKRNNLEDLNEAEHVCVEPYERPWLDNFHGIRLIRKPVQDCDLSLFRESLKENDILFIDSSHVIRTQGDVVFEYLNIMPSLNRGVIVHCHDIFLPREYSLKWIEGMKRFWNEQYLLQAILGNVYRYKPILAVNYLAHYFSKNLEDCCPIFKLQKEQNIRPNVTPPSSFWLRII